MSPPNSNPPKDERSEPSPPSAPRASLRVPAAWGDARDALAAVHNLETLLRSDRVSSGTISDLVPELRTSAGVLRQAFDQARNAGDAAAAVGAHGGQAVDAIERLLHDAESQQEPREELADRARLLKDELEASASLLALLERAAAPSTTEVSVDLLVRETSRLGGSGHGHELAVHFDEADPDGLVTTDPYVVGPLIALLVASVDAAGATAVVVRARCVPPPATFVVEAAGPSDGRHPVLSMRVMPNVPPTEQVARRVAKQIGAVLEWAVLRGSIALPITTG